MVGDEVEALTQAMSLLSLYVVHNSVTPEKLPELITATYAALEEIIHAKSKKGPEVGLKKFDAALTVRKSLASPDYILSMINGKPYKSLARHLASLGITPREYRERYNLPPTYPMTAPTYSQKRSEIASARGFRPATTSKS